MTVFVNLKENEPIRAEIVLEGLVQGVGFRYFALRNAQKFELKGFVKNLYTGDIFVVVEGPKQLIHEYIEEMKVGPMHAHVKGHSIKWAEPTKEFSRFEIRK